MNRLALGRIAIGVVAGLAASCADECGDAVYPAYPDLREILPRAVSSDDPLGEGDLVVGTGRMAQEGRRMFFQVQFADSAGVPLGDRQLTVQSPTVGFRGAVVDPTGLEAVVFRTVVGVKVGGVRRQATRINAPDCLALDGGLCHLADDLRVPVGSRLVVTARLDSLCVPTYCRITRISIPAMREQVVQPADCR